MQLNSGAINTTSLNGIARSSAINAAGVILAAFSTSALISVIQPANATASLDTDAQAKPTRVVLPIGAQAAFDNFVAVSGRRHVWVHAIATDVVTNAVTSAPDVTRYVTGTATSSIDCVASGVVTRHLAATASLENTANAIALRSAFGEAVTAVTSLGLSNGVRRLYAVAVSRFEITTDANAVTHAYAKAEATINTSVVSRLSVKQPAYAEASVTTTISVPSLRRKTRGISSAEFKTATSGRLKRTQWVPYTSPSVLIPTVSGRASHLRRSYSTPSVAQFSTTAVATVPSWADKPRFNIYADAVATRPANATANIYDAPMTARADVTRNVATIVSWSPDVYGSASVRLPTGGFLHDGYADASLELMVVTDDRLVIRYNGGLSIFSLIASANASQKQVVKKADANMVLSSSVPSTLVRRKTYASTITFNLDTAANATRVTTPVGASHIQAFSYTTPSAYRMAMGTTTAGTFTVEPTTPRLAVKATGTTTSLSIHTTATPRLRERVYGTSGLYTTTEATARTGERVYGTSWLYTVAAGFTVVTYAGKSEITFIDTEPVSAEATRTAMARGTAAISFTRYDATALSNLTTPAPAARLFVIQPTDREITVQPQNRTFDA